MTKRTLWPPRKATLKTLLASVGRGRMTAKTDRKMRDKLYHPWQSARKLGGGAMRKPEFKGR